MEIATIRFGNPEGSSLIVVCANGASFAVPWPCETWHAQFIQAWLDAGNTPAPAADTELSGA
jgi:hypothetical protein